MIAAPAAEHPPAEPARNPHAGAAAASTPPPQDTLDEAADLFVAIFKGDIVP